MTDFAVWLINLSKNHFKPGNEIFASHLLATRKQQPNETLHEVLHSLK